jgi:hypothetical protein
LCRKTQMCQNVCATPTGRKRRKTMCAAHACRKHRTRTWLTSWALKLLHYTWMRVQHLLHRVCNMCSCNASCPLQEASDTYLAGILGFETRPLVSVDYVNDSRSSIVDAACTQVGSSMQQHAAACTSCMLALVCSDLWMHHAPRWAPAVCTQVGTSSLHPGGQHLEMD